MAGVITYKPPPTIRAFIKHHLPAELFYSWIVGPVGSGKTTALFFKLVYMAKLQAKSPDGVRRTRAVVVRNTMPQLKDTTLVSWGYWFKDGQAGEWNATDKIFTLRFDDVECQVLFRPLDTPDDVNRVLSLEVHFAIIDEFVEIPRAIIDALSARLGRFRQPDGTPVTVWGMWGASNPSTEDNWWFDYLHGDVRRYGEDEHAHRARLMILDKNLPVNMNTVYFHQPSGFSAEAENLDYLPGGREYYVNLAKNRSRVWIKQFIEAEWGFSISGQAVIAHFNSMNQHIAKGRLQYNSLLPLVIGTDPGITGSALILMQENYAGQVLCLYEIIQRGYGIKRIITDRLMPIMRIAFPDCDPSTIVIALDPAGANRSPTDETTSRKIFEMYGFKVDCETNNRFPLRLSAYEHYLNTTAEGHPAFQVDPITCPILVRALKGGWRYAADVKKDILKGAEPDKNEYSHPGDACGYGLRYFHRGQLRFEKYGVRGRMAIPGSISGQIATMQRMNAPWGTSPGAALPALSRPPRYHFK